MDGITATAEIRKLPPPYCESHIFAVTAGAMPGDRERCLKAGMDAYVTKPLVPEEMLRVFLKFRAHWDRKALEESRKRRGLKYEAINVIEMDASPEETTAEKPKKNSSIQKEVVKSPPPKTVVKDFDLFDPSLTELQKLIGDNKQLQIDFIDPFIGELENYKISIKQDLSEFKTDNVKRAFHSLKTNCKIFGSFTLSEMCAEMEVLAKNEKTESISHKLDDFLDLLDRFKSLLAETSAILHSELE